MDNLTYRRARGQKGQTLVEFALVVALLLAIIFGIIEFGRLWFYSNHLNNSVRAAARYASVLGSTPGGFSRTAVLSYLTTEIQHSSSGKPLMDPAQIDASGTTVLVNGSPTVNPVRGDNIEVIVVYNFHLLSGSIIGKVVPKLENYQIIRSATMRYEG